MSDNVFCNFIAGQWVDSATNIANINPANTNDIIGHYAQADAEQTQQAINAAIEGQLQWQQSGLEQRYSVLMSIGDELIERKQE